MNRILLWAILLVTLSLGLIAGVAGSAAWLPERVATHFSGSGQPDGWMTRSGYLWFITAFNMGITAFMVIIFYVIRFMPASLINMPNKAYWLSPERRPYTNEVLLLQGLILSCLMVLFFAGLHVLTVVANQNVPVRLSGTGMGVLTVCFFVGLGFWLLTFWRSFRVWGSSTGS